MSYETFRRKRNEKLKGKLFPCALCGYKPKDYMDFVEHRESEHNIKRGEADVYP